MAHSVSHSSFGTSISFDSLPTLSSTARTRSAVLRRLADDLDVHNGFDLNGDKRVADVLDVLLNGCDAELDREGLETMLRLEVPRDLVAGDSRRNR